MLTQGKVSQSGKALLVFSFTEGGVFCLLEESQVAFLFFFFFLYFFLFACLLTLFVGLEKVKFSMAEGRTAGMSSHLLAVVNVDPKKVDVILGCQVDTNRKR